MRKTILAIISGIVLAAAGVLGAASLASATNGPRGGGHTPVTICHKPGTPAEHTITVDDDAVPAHLEHGDYLGACQTETTPTETEPTETTPTETTPTTPEPPFECPNGEEPIHGQNGNPGNDSCDPCAPPVNTEKCSPPPTETLPPTKPPETFPEPPHIVPPIVLCRPGTHLKKGKCVGNEAPITSKPKPPKPPKVRVSSVADGTPCKINGQKGATYKGKCHAIVQGSG